MTTQEHLNPFFRRNVVLTTRHPASVCAERVRADLAPFWMFWGSRQQMKGSASEERLRVVRWTGPRKALPSEARGSFVAGGQGTRLEMSIGWRRADLIGLGLAIPFMTAALVILMRTDPRESWVPIVFFSVVVVVTIIHRLATLHDDEWLVQHLCELMEATEIPEAF